MSWLTKVSNVAGKAEHFLNNLDQSTKNVLRKVQNDSSEIRSKSYTNLTEDDQELLTEELGRSGPSLPSRTHSELAGGIASGRRRVSDNFAPSTSSVTERDRRDNELISILNDDSTSYVHESDVVKGHSRQSSVHSVISAQTMQSLVSDHADVDLFKSQILAKDSQISIMRTKLAELERKLEIRSQRFYELKAEKELIEQRVLQQENTGIIEELKLAREKAQEQRNSLLDECNRVKKRTVLLEEEVRAMADQLSLAKFNLNENKKEFDQYKEKAQKILQAKEKLIDSLKAEENIVGGSDRPGHLLQAELEEMKVERDLARGDLESAQLMMYNLRSEVEELENQLRDEQNRRSEQKRQYMEEKHSWQATVSLLNEKVDCSRIEGEFIKQEMRRQNDNFVKKMEEKEAELRQSVEDERAKRREEEYRFADSHSTGEKLMQKQIELEEALHNNQILTLRLERIQKSSCETVIPIDPPSTIFPVHQLTTKKAVTVIDTITFKIILMLRNYPMARMFIFVYFVILHLWVFFIILTYTPEIHEYNTYVSNTK